jgi:propionyl-CoA synthetase
VVGVPDGTKGETPVGFVVLKQGAITGEQELEAGLIALVRKQIGPVASFKTAKVVRRLPKTRSGKVLRGTIRALAAGGEQRVPATIEDPVALEEVAQVLRELGHGPIAP